MLYSTVIYRFVRYCTVLYCVVLYCTVLCCIVLNCAVFYCIVLNCAVLNRLYYAVLCVLDCAVLHCSVWFAKTFSSYQHIMRGREINDVWHKNDISICDVQIYKYLKTSTQLDTIIALIQLHKLDYLIYSSPHSLNDTLLLSLTWFLGVTWFLIRSGVTPPIGMTHLTTYQSNPHLKSI